MLILKKEYRAVAWWIIFIPWDPPRVVYVWISDFSHWILGPLVMPLIIINIYNSIRLTNHTVLLRHCTDLLDLQRHCEQAKQKYILKHKCVLWKECLNSEWWSSIPPMSIKLEWKVCINCNGKKSTKICFAPHLYKI
jgi:hypothetical protein